MSDKSPHPVFCGLSPCDYITQIAVPLCLVIDKRYVVIALLPRVTEPDLYDVALEDLEAGKIIAKPLSEVTSMLMLAETAKSWRASAPLKI